MGIGEQFEFERTGRIDPEEGSHPKKTYNFFWGGPYSNWDPSDFTYMGIDFSCTEQMMMLGKALLFGDDSAALRIMETYNPSVQKAWGKKVRRFNKDVWDPISYSIVYAACYSKFSQSADHRFYMLNDSSNTIVEASPYDTIWGIGMGERDKDILDESKWRGENRLGKVLMDVRRFLKNPMPYADQHLKFMNECEDLFKSQQKMVNEIKSTLNS